MFEEGHVAETTLLGIKQPFLVHAQAMLIYNYLEKISNLSGHYSREKAQHKN